MPAIAPGEHVAVTIDPCPVPVVCLLDGMDYYHYGWLTAVINVSDLAAMGARPIGITVSTVMAPEMKVGDFERFLDGLVAATSAFECPVLGGNIKDGEHFDAVGSAFGSVDPTKAMRRTGLRESDRICVVGEMGLFWAAVLSKLNAKDSDLPPSLRQSLYRPVPRVQEGQALASTGAVTACVDSSDGVGACLRELAVRNGVDLVIDAPSLWAHEDVSRIASALDVDARKLMLSWGNWELVCGIRRSRLGAAQDAVAARGGTMRDIGEVTSGNGIVWFKDASGLAPLADFASRRFAESSYFTHGLESYVTTLREQSLTVSNR